MIMTLDLQAARETLLTLRDELALLSASSEEDRSAVTLDQQSVGRLSRMNALQNQAMAMATERQRTAQIARIDAALRRVDEGEYGYCVQCGEAIDPQRLEIDPAAPQCVKCAGL